MIPSLLVILKATKPYQTWYTQSHVGVLTINRRECQRNNIIRQFGLRDFPPLLLKIHDSSSTPLLIILKTAKPYQTWYTPVHVGVVGINRREWQWNNIIRQSGL